MLFFQMPSDLKFEELFRQEHFNGNIAVTGYIEVEMFVNVVWFVDVHFVRIWAHQSKSGLLLFQVELWQKYIGWEKSNPLRTEDTALLTRRVVFALEQCLLCLGHHADIWYQAAQFLEHSCKVLQEKGVSFERFD